MPQTRHSTVLSFIGKLRIAVDRDDLPDALLAVFNAALALEGLYPTISFLKISGGGYDLRGEIARESLTALPTQRNLFNGTAPSVLALHRSRELFTFCSSPSRILALDFHCIEGITHCH